MCPSVPCIPGDNLHGKSVTKPLTVIGHSYADVKLGYVPNLSISIAKASPAFPVYLSAVPHPNAFDCASCPRQTPPRENFLQVCLYKYVVHHAFLEDEQIEQCHRELELDTLPEACKRLLISGEFVQVRKAFSGSPSFTMQVQWVEVLEI